MGDSIDQLKERFLAEARERSTDVNRLLGELPTAADHVAVSDEIREHAHKLKGAAGMLGFDAIKDAATLLEETARAQAAATDAAAAESALAPAAAGLAAVVPG